MGTRYEEDVVLWSLEQARALRERDFSKLDIERLADEIEDVGRSEKRELANRMAVLLAHLVKWLRQPERRSNSWRSTIRHQRERTGLLIKGTPSLIGALNDADWRRDVWLDAVQRAAQETGLDESAFPETCPWDLRQVLDADFWPESRPGSRRTPAFPAVPEP
jgi:hypothetical protein